MSSILKYAFILATLMVSQPNEKIIAEGSITTSTRRTVEALFGAFNRHDLDDVMALYDKNTRLITPGFPEPRYGQKLVRDEYRNHFEQIPGVHDAVTRIICEGEYAAVEFIASWEQPTEFNAAARGQVRIAAIIKVVDGKITEDTAYFDRMAFK